MMGNAHQFSSLAVENTADTMNFLVPWIIIILSCHSRARERETERKTENRNRDGEENPMYRRPNRNLPAPRQTIATSVNNESY